MQPPASNAAVWPMLVVFQILTIAASNYLVQWPIQIFGFHSTWGAFTFPFVYLSTDLTVRVLGARTARRVIFVSMFPALLLTYLVSTVWHEGHFVGFDGLATFNAFVGRIALASFAAYLVGQLMDIKVFNRLRQVARWWVAPATSSLVGNLVDTMVFFSVAFYASSNAFMATNWVEIATVDFVFKVVISVLIFLPAYGLLLNFLSRPLLRSPNLESQKLK